MPDDLREIRERTKRIETRLTQLMIAQGIPTTSQRPTFHPSSDIGRSTMQLPSPHTSMKEIAAAVPRGKHGEPFDILVGTELVGRLVVTRA